MGSAKVKYKEELYTENESSLKETFVGKDKLNHNEQIEHESSLKGTIISVGVVGLTIFIVYVIIFGLYMSRV